MRITLSSPKLKSLELELGRREWQLCRAIICCQNFKDWGLDLKISLPPPELAIILLRSIAAGRQNRRSKWSILGTCGQCPNREAKHQFHQFPFSLRLPKAQPQDLILTLKIILNFKWKWFKGKMKHNTFCSDAICQTSIRLQSATTWFCLPPSFHCSILSPLKDKKTHQILLFLWKRQAIKKTPTSSYYPLRGRDHVGSTGHCRDCQMASPHSCSFSHFFIPSEINKIDV